MIKLHDATLIDSVFGYCALHQLNVNSLAPLTFLQVTKLLAETVQQNPQWIYASWEIRKYYDICHEDCHIGRIQAFMRSGGWRQGEGPLQEAKADNVVEFPTNHTKH